MHSFRHVLVTGGAGAIGSQVAADLLARGIKTTVVDDISSGNEVFVPAGAKFIRGSIESEEVVNACFEADVDGVIHCAAFFANQNSVDHPIKDLSVNGTGIIRLLQKAQSTGVRKFLYTSSSCVYGAEEMMSEERAPGNLDTPYAISKLLGEQYCKFWSQHHSLDTVIVRIFNNYGPGELPGQYRNVIPNFFKLALEQKSLPITGEGTETRDFNFVSDTLAGIMLAFFSETKPGDIFNIGRGQETQILDLARLINAITNNPAPLQFLPPRKWDHVKHRKAVVAKAEKKLGFRARTKLEDGLSITLSWLRDHRRFFG